MSSVGSEQKGVLMNHSLLIILSHELLNGRIILQTFLVEGAVWVHRERCFVLKEQRTGSSHEGVLRAEDLKLEECQ